MENISWVDDFFKISQCASFERVRRDTETETTTSSNLLEDLFSKDKVDVSDIIYLNFIVNVLINGVLKFDFPKKRSE